MSVCISVMAYKDVNKVIASSVEWQLKRVSDERAKVIHNTIIYAPPHKRETLAYLFAYMPKGDLDSIAMGVVKESVDYAVKARSEMIWGEEVPLLLFYNDVLPYASLDETREKWRGWMYERIVPLVKECMSAREAVEVINKELKNVVGVEYNTKRNKANQSVLESVETGMASCTGLSILLVSALRSVGIPARVAGVPMWVSMDGNHNWVEVWIDGEWNSIEYYPAELNSGWIYSKIADMEGRTEREHQVYASSFMARPKPSILSSRDTIFTDSVYTYFPLVWNTANKNVNAVKVTERYMKRCEEMSLLKEKGKGLWMDIVVVRKGGDANKSEDRMSVDITIEKRKGEVVWKGESRSKMSDLNDIERVWVPKRGWYKVRYGERSKWVWVRDSGRQLVVHN